MIFLFEDRKIRQIEYNWDIHRFDKYKQQLVPVFNYNPSDFNTNRILKPNNVVLYHDSFQDTSSPAITSLLTDFKKKLDDYAINESTFCLVYFSGSIINRRQDENIAHIPVNVLYNNLELFVRKFKKNEHSLEHIIFGDNFNIESELIQNLKSQNSNKSNSKLIQDINNENFIIKTLDEEISDYFENAYNAIFYKDVSDETIDDFIKKHLLQTKYKNIFIPLCIGNTLSDYNGLRIATHIRTTNTENQLSNIFIYSIVPIEYFLEHEFFDILKTKNVFLIDYSKSAFESAYNLNKSLDSLKTDELPIELKKLKLDIPLSLNNSHNITNHWAIYKWNYLLKIKNNIDNSLFKFNLYFKYLQTIYCISESKNGKKINLNFNCPSSTNILLVDDQENIGWNEIFSLIFKNTSQISFSAIGNELRKREVKDIIKEVLKSIEEKNIDIVLLDIRLHESDINDNDFENTTGYQILKEIKQINSGIQIIIFSAMSKALNLLKIQQIGADGVVLKENPTYSMDSQFSMDNFKYFKDVVHRCISRKYLKEIREKLDCLVNLALDHKNNIEIAYDILYSSHNINKNLNYAYLQLFLIIEDFSKQPKILLNDTQGDYYVLNKQQQQLLVFQKQHSNYISAITYDEKNYCYIIKNNSDFKNKIDLFARISALLIFRYGFTDSNKMKWVKLNSHRNDIGHNIKTKTKVSDIHDLIDFIIYVFTTSNISDVNNDKILKEKFSLEDLKEKYNSGKNNKK